MRSSRNVSFIESLQAELDRQFAAARVVLKKLASDNADIEISALNQVRHYANVMFREVWTEADASGKKIFTSPVKYLVMIKDLDMLLRFRDVAISAGLLAKYDQEVLANAEPAFGKRYQKYIAQVIELNKKQDEHAIPVKAVMGSYPSLQPKPAKPAKLVRFYSVPRLHVELKESGNIKCRY